MNKEPWKLPYTPWKTQAAFYSYIRGGLRRSIWSRHPCKTEYMKSVRFKSPIGVNGKDVWTFECEICNGHFRQNEIEVDHLEEAGSLRCEEDLHGFITRLAFIDFDDIQIVCKPCHRILTNAAKKGLSFEESRIDKECIAFNKLNPSEQYDIIRQMSDEEVAATKPKRKEQYRKLLKEKSKQEE